MTVVSASLASAAAVRARSLSLPRAAAAASRSPASRRFLALRTTRVARSASTSSPATSRTTTTKITYMGIRIPVDQNGQLTTSCDAVVRGFMFDATRSEQPEQPPRADNRRIELLAAPSELAVRGHYQARFVTGGRVGDHADNRVVA